MAEKKHVLPYRSMDEAVKDGFKKIGGPENAYRMLDTGNYALCERKVQNEKNQKLRELMKQDPRFKSLRDQVRKQVS